MAERRMFAKAIIESDTFMDMPAEAQMLYIRLNMAADDDGFCDNPRSIMRSCGASDDSMKLLVAKKFVITFSKQDNFVVVIKHWRLNNYIRKDTYHETKYREFMRELYYDENNSYSLNPGDGHRPCLPPKTERDESVTEPSRDRDDPLTQVRLDKSKGRLEEERLDKDINNNSSFVFEEEKKEEADPSNDTEERAERISHFAKMADFFAGRGWDTDGPYRLASNEGIAPSEIDSAREVWNEKAAM